MEKLNLDEKMKKLGEEKNKGRKQKICIPDNMKLCPFQSSPDEEVPCTHRCALYRGNKQMGYNCPLIELTSIGWVLKGSPQRGGGNNYQR